MNINQLMKQAQQMQKKLADAQAQIEQLEVEGASGGGMVKVTITGKGRLKAIAIDPKIIDANEKEMLEDLIVAAINDANDKKEASSENMMSGVAGGMNLPAGFKLPF
jgi:DNA-binding YbaB/EbfC family protein